MKLRSFLILVIGLLTAVPTFAQGYVDFLPDDLRIPFKEKWQKIGEDRSSERDEWEGEYSRDLGATFTHILRWDKRNGFAVFQDTCSYGPRAWVNTGNVIVTPNGSIMFIPERNAEAPFSLATPSGEYVPIKWGEQHWLVPKPQLRLFAYVVNSGSAFDLGSFYLRVQDQEKERTGLPELPKEFMAVFKMKSIKARVISVGNEEDIWKRKMTIDAGSNQKVIEGMTFFLQGKKGTTVTAVVTEVASKTSMLRLTSIGYVYDVDAEDGKTDDSDRQDFEPTPGLRFSSKMPDFYSDQLIQ